MIQKPTTISCASGVPIPSISCDSGVPIPSNHVIQCVPILSILCDSGVPNL
ncbi:unnamed protein product, partial [Staurois parvus]